MELNPWDHHPDLSELRLRRIAAILADTRHEALELYDPKNGDGEWSLGCRIYQRSCNRIVDASSEIPWLSIIDPSLEFVFALGVVPVRFYRGQGDSPSPRNLACSYNEMRQMNLAFKNDAPELVWRFAVETNLIGQVTQIIFLGSASDAEIVCYYPVPIADQKVTFLKPERRRGGGVDLPPPTVTDIPLEQEQHKGDQDGQDRD